MRTMTSFAVSLALVVVSVARCGGQVCASQPSVRNEYTPKGRTLKIGTMEIYETEAGGSSLGTLIHVHDILGLNTNAKQVADLVAQHGRLRVVLPDFFRGKSPYTKANPPRNQTAILAFIGEHGNWTRTTRRDLLAVMEHYSTTHGVKTFGIFGFCWGGHIAVMASKEMKDFKAGAIIHPGMVTNEDGLLVQAPFFIMPSRAEPDMMPFLKNQEKRFPWTVGHRRFEMFHGFAGGSANLDDAENGAAVVEVVKILSAFFYLLM